MRGCLLDKPGNPQLFYGKTNVFCYQSEKAAFVLSVRNYIHNASMKSYVKLQSIVLSEVFDLYSHHLTKKSPGLLLMRVRDELKMTIAAYQTLYQSSVTFGMQKLLQSEKGKTELEQRIAMLEKKKAELEDKVII